MVVASLIVIEAVIGTAYAIGGAGYVLDDWFAAGRGRVFGVTSTTLESFGRRRPGATIVYGLEFGLLGGRPLLGLFMLTTLSAVTAVLWYLLLRRFLPRPFAAAGALLWAVLPNHTALEFWQSCVHIDVAVPLALMSILLVSGETVSRRRMTLALALLVAATLTYEAVLPAAAFGIIVTLVAHRRSPIRWRVGAVLLIGAACVGYQLAFPDPSKRFGTELAPVQDALPGQFGWGIVGNGTPATLLLVFVLTACVVAIIRLVLPSFRPADAKPEVLIVSGLVVVMLGALPFTFYFYAPLGAGDRFNLASAFGAVLVWLGIALWVRRAPLIALAGAAALVALALPARVDRQRAWTTAAGDGERVADAILERFPRPLGPSGSVVLGPAPIQRRNIAAFLDQSNVQGMLQYLYGRNVPSGIAYSVEDFDHFPPNQRFDLRELSRLQADFDLSSDRQGVPVTPRP